MGIAKYNAHCRSIVTRYTKEWERTVTRIGRWIDFKNDYKTLGKCVGVWLWGGGGGGGGGGRGVCFRLFLSCLSIPDLTD